MSLSRKCKERIKSLREKSDSCLLFWYCRIVFLSWEYKLIRSDRSVNICIACNRIISNHASNKHGSTTKLVAIYRGRMYSAAAAVDEQADDLAWPDFIDTALLRARRFRTASNSGAFVRCRHREVAPAGWHNRSEESHQQRNSDKDVSLLWAPWE